MRKNNKFTSRWILINNLKKLIDETDAVLDLGCGNNSPLLNITCNFVLGLDIYFYKSTVGSDAIGTRSKEVRYYKKKCDLRYLGSSYDYKSFDVCCLIDVIEHFKKESGINLLKNSENIARKVVIVSTPNGYLEQHDNRPFFDHLSGWTVDEFKSLGYKVIGFGGLKCLRGKYNTLKYKPRFLWGLVSLLFDYIWCRKHPKSAAILLCWKEVEY
jgi:hypothetical protein